MLFSRVAVTGGAGRIGRHVVRELAGDCDVTVVDIVPPVDGGAFVRADMRDPSAVRAALRGHDAVIHLAALDDGAVPQEEAFIDVNVRGTWHVLQAAEELAIERVVFCSSVSALGLGPGFPPQQLPIPVDHPLLPTSSYGVSKLAGEAMARAFVRRSALEVVCLRPCLVAQADIAYGIARRAAELDGTEPPPAASGENWRPLDEELSPTRAVVTPEDVARAFRAALTARGLRFGIYYVTGPDSCSALATVATVARGYGIEPRLAQPLVYQDNPRASAYDLAPAREALGWEPQDPWDDYMARVVAAG